jgi:hypothetical protein
MMIRHCRIKTAHFVILRNMLKFVHKYSLFTVREQNKKVNMDENKIVSLALESLYNDTGIEGKWQDYNDQKDLDGKVDLIIDQQHLNFNIDVKKELRERQLAHVFQLAKGHPSLMVIAERIFPKIKDELRKQNISYLEANGNIYLKQNGIFIWIEGKEPIPQEKERANRAFTKTGLKVVFHFLLDENYIKMPHREIAHMTDVGLGNINYVFNGLKETGFLLKLNKDEYKLVNKKELLDKWMTGYKERLYPSLHVGSFRFLKPEDFERWKDLPLEQGKSWWGGEPGGYVYTHYLRPEELTLYTLETRTELMKKYRLVPDVRGNVKVFKKFWYNEEQAKAAPPLLVYADLMNTEDRRCMETAKRIYDEFLQDEF